MDSVAQENSKAKVPSAPHTFVGGVEGKVCGLVRRVKIVPACGKWKPITEYWGSKDYQDNRSCICADCSKAWKAAKKAGTAYSASDAHGALALRDPRPVVFDDLGISAHVGWHGDVEYFPITPLLSLTKYATEHGLLGAIQNDELVGAVAKKFVVLASDGKRYATWHLPWSHFSAFCLKFGNEQTKLQQDRAQQVLEVAFGKTAQSNRDTAHGMDQGSLWRPDVEHGVRTVVREEVRAALLEENERLESRTMRHDVFIDRPVDGRVYIAEEPRKVLQSSTSMDVLRRLDRGWRYLFISESGRGEAERLAEYAKKRGYGVPLPVLRKVILSDRRKKLEEALHRHVPEGVWKVPSKRDEFMVSPDAYDCLVALPDYIGSTDIPRLKHWTLCQSIFETVQQ
jgi:hypothetical protein